MGKEHEFHGVPFHCHTAAVKIIVGFSICALTALAVTPAWSQIAVEPGARQIFAKAAKRYGHVNSLQLRWKDTATEQFEKGGDIMGYAHGSLAFDRRGLLNWQSTAQSSRYSLVVVDSKNTSLLLSEKVNLRPHPAYERQPTKGRQTALDQLGKRGDWFPTLSQWLQGISPLTRSAVIKLTQNSKITRYSAKTLPTAKFSNQPCDLVRVNVTYHDKKSLQETYWFQKAGGQLVRIQRKASTPGSAGNDIRIEAQQLNPKLAATTFRFVPPKKATLVSAH
ncbi:hypothetical protein IAD21_00983 [Abditibacteriota bacterium]|nr:hypothetical protein IAD21_00983 [Abditibacteriota bacterium]